MAQIIIREKDLTGNPAASVFDVAFVPGLTIENLNDEDSKYQYDKPYYFNTLSGFQEAFGEKPVELTGLGIPYTVDANGNITCPNEDDPGAKYFFASTDGIQLDRGYIYASELLTAGIPIYYLPIAGTTAQAVYDALKGSQNTSSVLYQLADRGTFNIKYLTSGGYPTYEYNNNSIVDIMLQVAGARDDTTDDYNDNPASSNPNGRGDCVALIDHFELDERPLLGDGSVYNRINTVAGSGEGKDPCGLVGKSFLSYGAMFTPYAEYRLSQGYQYLDNGDTKVLTTIHFPGSFAYMTCLAKQLSAVLPSYEAVAGVSRGTVTNIVYDNSTNAYKMCTKDVLTNYIANYYNNPMSPNEGQGRGSISINAITQINPYGMVIYGTRTLAEKSQVDGVKATGVLNIRNMVSDIKKQMYQSARRYMYSANTDALWINFKSSVAGLLDQLQSGYGIKAWSMKKDTVKSTKSSIFAVCTIVPIYPVEKFDITIEITDDDISVAENN